MKGQEMNSRRALCCLLLLLFTSLFTGIASGKPVDASRPVEIQSSFFKTEIRQDGELVSDAELLPVLDLLPEAESDLEMAGPAWDIGYGLTLMSPFILAHGMTLASSSWKRGEGSVLLGATALGAGIYLLNWSVRLRASAAKSFNESIGVPLQVPPLHLRFDLVGATHDSPAIAFRFEFD